MIALFDGGCKLRERGAGAAVLYRDDGAEIARRATYLPGPHVTTNIAEFCGLVNAIQLGIDHGATTLRVLGDSELVVRQFNGVYACRRWYLRVWRDRARELALQVDECSVGLLPKGGPKNKRRHANHEADALATRCMALGNDIDEISD